MKRFRRSCAPTPERSCPKAPEPSQPPKPRPLLLLPLICHRPTPSSSKPTSKPSSKPSLKPTPLGLPLSRPLSPTHSHPQPLHIHQVRIRHIHIYIRLASPITADGVLPLSLAITLPNDPLIHARPHIYIGHAVGYGERSASWVYAYAYA